MGCSSRIPDPGSGFFSIPDPGLKKAPDPGSGSATMLFRISKRHQWAQKNPHDIGTIVVDPWHFATDPDPRIRSTDLRIRIRIRVLFFSTVDDKMPTAFLLITFWRYIYISFQFSYIKTQKDVKNSRNQGFSYFFCLLMEGSGSGSSKTFGSTTLIGTVDY